MECWLSPPSRSVWRRHWKHGHFLLCFPTATTTLTTIAARANQNTGHSWRRKIGSPIHQIEPPTLNTGAFEQTSTWRLPRWRETGEESKLWTQNVCYTCTVSTGEIYLANVLLHDTIDVERSHWVSARTELAVGDWRRMLTKLFLCFKTRYFYSSILVFKQTCGEPEREAWKGLIR